MGEYREIAPMVISGNLSENWSFWKQKFLNYLEASEMCKKSGSTQCAQLLHYIGDDGIRIYNTFSIAEEKKGKLKILLEKFENHFSPKKNLSFERYKFFTRKQLVGEFLERFITDLKNKANSCEFGELKDGLVKCILTCGILNEKL
ncbi:hypothetical protein RN001_002635 [Aquatica leii]|uniref:Uncharacterized protein n=1 Tax=Aquatica leii TaxID=1421715 RepID=A0AAN7SLX4_9COLE|nr:hypothetical protein RN001_002635 [Aquatica leii]